MKKIFLTLAVFVMAICANAQNNQYFWYQGNLMMGNPIAQIDSVTFGEGEPVDTLHIMLPRTIIKTIAVHDTVIVHDTIFINKCEHEYVDLGLPSGTLWATCNVGASTPEDPGFYFRWGETDSTTIPCSDKVEGRDSKYLDCHNDCVRKYCTTSNYACEGYIVDNLVELESSDDAATMNWGDEWITPSSANWQELATNCIWTWTIIEGMNGYEVKGPNGNKIFIPASGDTRWSAELHNIGTTGGLWSRDVWSAMCTHVYSLYFTSTSINASDKLGRNDCQTVRPVRKTSN